MNELEAWVIEIETTQQSESELCVTERNLQHMFVALPKLIKEGKETTRSRL